MTEKEPHALDPLLAPRSIALFAVSGREGRPGRLLLESIKEFGVTERVYPINPNYDEILGYRCLASAQELPEAVDLAVLAGGTERMLGHLKEAIGAGAKAAFILATSEEEEPSEPPLLVQVTALAQEAGIPLLGPYSIGFVNYAAGIGITWMKADAQACGGIAAVVQSGATYGYINALDPRIEFCLTVQPGQEATHSIADFMDYALSMPQTKVLALYIETLRDPAGFQAALARAQARNIPVVAIKPGRTEAGRAGVLSHAGRLAGSEAGVEAVFRHYGVIRAETMDEWLSTALFFEKVTDIPKGGMAAILDSGGQRSLMLDYAEELGVPWSKISAATEARLRERLAYFLPAENPVDAWGGDADYPEVYKDCFKAIVSDPDTALGLYITEFGAKPSDLYLDTAARVCKEVREETGKPVAAACFTARQFHHEVILDLSRDGVPVLENGRTAIQVVGHGFARRDFRPPDEAPSPNEALITNWRERLDEGLQSDLESFALLEDFGLPVVPHRHCSELNDVLQAGRDLGWPVVLKTAEGIAHKSEAGGVRLNLTNEQVLEEAYEDMASRLGPQVLVMAQAERGAELSLGLVQDPQFGPLVMLGAGGVLVELLHDRVFALPPFGPDMAASLLETLSLVDLLRGYRDRPPCDWQALCQAISAFSRLAADLGDLIVECDVNPLIAGESGVVAVDALIKVGNPRALESA